MKNHFSTSGAPASRQALLAATLCAAACAAGPARAAPIPPAIASVVFTPSGGTYSARISGLHFGAAPGGIPCTDCTPLQLQVVNLANTPAQEPVSVTAWSDTSNTVTGIAASAGDAMQLAVYNASAGNAGAWGGRVSHAINLPFITSIVAVPHGRKTMVTITGGGFGAAPPQVGQTTTSPFLILTDFNPRMGFSGGFPWSGGFCNETNCNQVTADYASWTDTKVVIAGYGADRYGGDGGAWEVHPLDAFCVGIWASTNSGDGKTGGVTKCIRLPK